MSLHIYDQDVAVANFLNQTNLRGAPLVRYSALFTHYDRTREMDKFLIIFTSSKGVSETFDFSTGTGHRATRKSGTFGPIIRGKDKGKLKELREITGLDTVTWKQGDNLDHLVIAPTQASVLWCLLMDMELGQGTFQEFCDNLGYDSDSMRAHKIYLDSQNTLHKMHNILTRSDIEHLRELLQDY